MTDRVVLAYSGGLDTSVAIGWIAAETGAEVIAVAADVGQGGEDLDVIRQRALACGAVEAVVVDARDEFAERVLPAGAEGERALHGPLPAGLGAVAAGDRASTWSRPRATTTRRPSRTAAPARATTRCGSRSASAPSRRTSPCIAPVRDSGMTRDKAIAFAEEREPADRRDQEVAVLHRPERLGPRGRDRLPRRRLERPDRGRLLLHPGPGRRRGTPDEVIISFTDGAPTAIDGQPGHDARGDPAAQRACRRAGDRAARHGRGPAGRDQEPRGLRGARRARADRGASAPRGPDDGEGGRAVQAVGRAALGRAGLRRAVVLAAEARARRVRRRGLGATSPATSG